MQLTQERKGELFSLLAIILWSLFPVVMWGSSNILNPLFFAGSSMLASGLLFLILIIFLGKTKELLSRKALPSMGASSLLLLAMFGLLFIAGQKVLPGDFAILSQVEIIFTLIFFGFLGLETITKNKLIGAFLILAGSIFILAQGVSGQFSIWALVVILAYIFAPWGNFFQKKAVKTVSTFTHLCFRMLLSSLIFLLFSFWLGYFPQAEFLNAKTLWLILFNGLIIFGLRTIFFLNAIKRIDISKTIALSGSTPAFTLTFAFLFLGQAPTLYQAIGFFLTFIGVMRLVER